MSDETMTEQLAEIEGQAAEYTPPDGWRVLQVGEKLQPGDMWVMDPPNRWRPTVHVGAFVRSNQRYIRRIEPEPQPQAQPQPQAATIEEPRSEAVEVNKKRLQQVVDLRNELNHVERLWGESRQRVTELEELVTSLRTINEGTEKAVRLANQQNTDLEHRLKVVSAEWAEQAGTINGLRAHVEAVEADVVQQRLERNRYQNQVLRLTAELDEKTTECRNLRIELDALQQAPQAETMAATPPATEYRFFSQGWDAGTARAVETIAEWLEPIRHLIDAADNMAETEEASNLAADIIRALPAIMRSLTGLTPED